MSQDDGGNFGNNNISPALPWKRIGTFTKHIRLPQRSKTFCADALFVMSSGARHLSVFARKARKRKSNSKRFLHFGRNDRWQSCEQTAKDATVVDHRYRRIAGDTPAPTTLAPLQLG